MKDKRKYQLSQYFAAMSASLAVIGYGTTISWTSPSLPYLNSTKSEFPVSERQASWIASIVNLGMVLGYILNALIVDKVGRKRALLIVSIPQITGCILTIAAKNWFILFISRAITGVGYGAGLCSAILYFGEIGNQNTRGIFLAIVKLSINVGIFFALLLGAYLPYNQMNIVLLLLPLIFIATFFFMPDSSHFLERERKKLSEESKEKNPKEFEMKLIVNSNQEENEEKLESKLIPEPLSYLGRLQKLFTSRSNQKGLLIVSFVSIIDVLSGHAAVVAFTQEIFDYSESSLSPQYATLVMASMKIVTLLFSTQIIEKVDRRTLFLSCGILATILNGIVGIFFLMKYNTNMDVSSFSWIPLCGVTMYEMVGNLGIGSMAIVYAGELFSPDVAGVGVTITNVVYDTTAFLVKLQFRVVLQAIGISGIFFLFALCCVLGTVTFFYLVPETRGKSLEEIQTLLLGTREKKKNGVKRFC